MKLRLGLITGLGLGYYMGAKAGRERYVQINSMIRKVRRSEAYQHATDRAEAVVDLSVEKAKGFVGDHLPHNGRETTPV